MLGGTAPAGAVLSALSGSARLLAQASLLLLALTLSVAAQPVAVAPQSVTVEATKFRAELPDGRVLYSPDLVGAVLTLGPPQGRIRLRIDAVEPDPGDPAHSIRPSSVLLHTLSVQAPDGSWGPLCKPGPDGRRDGFPLAGRSRPDATIAPAEPGAFEVICTGGAQGKCVRLGYHPWERTRDGTPLDDAYNACIRLLRADYAGDGYGTTRDGQRIDIYDRFGIQSRADDPGDEFEAGWTAGGAVCVRHVRVPQNISLNAVEASASRLAGRVGDICTEAFARAAGAILFNRSPPSR